MLFRVETFAFEMSGPKIVGLLIEGRGITFGGSIDSRIKALGRDSPDIDDEFPSPSDGFFFKVITEGPVAQHLEKGMMVGVVTNIFQVIMLTTSADAFLRICGACGRIRRFFGAEEVGHELIHSRIGKQQAGRLWHQRSRRHRGVLLRGKEVEKGLADFGGGHDERKSCEAD